MTSRPLPPTLRPPEDVDPASPRSGNLWIDYLAEMVEYIADRLEERE